MTKQISHPQPPTGLSRILWRLPILFYRVGLGWMLGRRFLLLNHIGRKSGLPRQTVLEVVDYDKASDTYFIAAGFGAKSDWYQNLLKTPQTSIQVGKRHLTAIAEPLSSTESGEAMVQYARRNPRAAQSMTRIIGHQVDGSDDDYRALGQEVIPFVALKPVTE